MTEHELEDILYHLLASVIYMADQDDIADGIPEEWAELDSVRTFEEAGLLTRDKGVVLRFKDRSEYQVSIIRSR